MSRTVDLDAEFGGGNVTYLADYRPPCEQDTEAPGPAGAAASEPPDPALQSMWAEHARLFGHVRPN